MSYERCVATYLRLREEHRDNPELLALVEQFGYEIAYLRTHEELTAKLEAQLAIEKARDSSSRG